jgi:hypothetical protein
MAKFPKTIGQCVDQLYAMRASRLEYEAEAEKMKEQETALREHILNSFNKTDIEGAKGRAATAAITRKTVAKVNDWDQLYAYIYKNKAFDLLHKRVTDKAGHRAFSHEAVGGVNMVAKKTDLAVKPKAGAVTKWSDELAKYATEGAEKEVAPAGAFVSFKSGVLTVGGQRMDDNKLNCIVLDSVYENALYEGDYDQENPKPPVCYAFAQTEEGLRPHEKAPKPQYEGCKGCPQNEFGTAERGKGKACKNIRRLAIISADAMTPEAVAEAEVFGVKVPVTSVKGWAYYVKGLNATLKRPPFAVVTEMKVIPDEKWQFRVQFKALDNVPDELIEAIIAKRESYAEQLIAPYPEAREDEAPAKPAKKRKF